MRLLCVFSLLLPVTAVADVLFSDSTIDLSNYTTSAVYLDPGVTLQNQNCGACGNPGGGYEETVTLPVGGGSAVFGLINNGFVYNPATEGAIDSLTASADTNVTVNRPPGGGFTPVFVPLLEQGGNYYISVLYGNSFEPGVTTIGYQTISESGLMAADFGQIDFQSPSNPLISTYNLYSNPDFSSTGAPIQFGFAPIVWVNDQFQIQADYANLSFDIAPAVSVPEPAFMAPLLSLMGLFLGSFRRSSRVGSRGN